MKKTVLMNAAKKARIALSVMALCGMSFVGAQEAFAAIEISGTNNTITNATDSSTVIGTENELKGLKVLYNTDFNILGSGNSFSGSYISLPYYQKSNTMTIVGSQNTVSGVGNTVIGSYNKGIADRDVVLGNKLESSKSGGNRVIVGNDISTGSSSNSCLIGNDIKASTSVVTVLGNFAKAENAVYSVAVGNNSSVTSNSSAAFGYAASASKINSVALGANSNADEENTVSVGGTYEDTVFTSTGPMNVTKYNKRRIVNVDEGKKDTDAATVGQVITNIKKNGNTLEFYTGKGADGNGTKKWEFDLAAGGSTLTQDDFNNMLNASTKFNDLQTAVGNKANANGDNITTGAGSKWAETLGTGAIVDGDKNLVNGETVYNKIGDTDKLTAADLGSNLSDAVVKVNTKAEAAQTTANSALDKAKANENKIGDLAKLDTAEKGNLVGAVNEVNNKATANETKIGDLTKLKTTEKGNLVGAVNEVNKKADKNAKDIASLGGRVDTLGGAVSKLDTKVNKVGAGAAALAALHPMDFDPDNKLTFAAGVGNYRGANAAAIGAFYRPNEQVMFSIAGNMGNGENMVNAGVSFALDRPSKTPTTKAALVKTVAAQNEQIAALNETVAEQNEKIARLEAMVEKLVAKQNA